MYQSIIDAGSKFWSDPKLDVWWERNFINLLEDITLKFYLHTLVRYYCTDSKKGKMDWLKRNTKIKKK